MYIVLMLGFFLKLVAMLMFIYTSVCMYLLYKEEIHITILRMILLAVAVFTLNVRRKYISLFCV